MNPDLKWAMRFFLGVLRAMFWVFQTAWLGLFATVRTIRFFKRLPDLRAEDLICPRGHASPAYGVFECSSAAPVHLHEGWVFDRCRVCGLSAGWTPCQVCGLPILSPLRNKR